MGRHRGLSEKELNFLYIEQLKSKFFICEFFNASERIQSGDFNQADLGRMAAMHRDEMRKPLSAMRERYFTKKGLAAFKRDLRKMCEYMLPKIYLEESFPSKNMIEMLEEQNKTPKQTDKSR